MIQAETADVICRCFGGIPCSVWQLTNNSAEHSIPEFLPGICLSIDHLITDQ